MAFTQGDQRTWPLWFACYHQSDPKWLPWHHHYSFSSVPYVATILKREVEEKIGEEELLKRRGAAKVSKKIAAKHSPNNRFPNTLSEGVGCRCNPGVQQQRASEFSCQYRMFEIFEARSPLPCPPPLLMPSSLFTLLFISLLAPPLSLFNPSLPFRVQRPESNLQQLSKSGMTDKLIFSSWVYIPGIWAADLAPNKRRVSASCLLKLMFSWPEMNYPVTRIYLYSS